jgi:hypothetical protein
MSVAYQVSAIAGGVTPLLSLWLLRQSGAPWPAAALLVGVAGVSFLCVAIATAAAPGRQVLAR